MVRILAVDDHEEILHIVKSKLGKSGYDVETLSDAAFVLQKVRVFKPQIVLMDIMMPKITGFELCREIKSDKKLKGIKVIFLTAKDMDFARDKAEEVGGDGFIAKPFSPNELLEYINQLVSSF